MKSLPKILGFLLGTLSVVMLLKRGFDVGFIAPLELMLEFYNRLTHLLFGWLEPEVTAVLTQMHDWWPWQVHLFPHWKHVFVLMSLYFLRSAYGAFNSGWPVSAVFRALWGLLTALVASVIAGTLPAAPFETTANFLVVAVPIIGVSVSDLGWNAWWAVWLRRKELNWWQDFLRTESYTLGRDIIGIVLAFVGVQIPAVERLPNPGLAVLAFLIVALAFFYIALGIIDANYNRRPGETWVQGFRRDGGARLGLAMLGIMLGAAAFVATNAGLTLIGL